MSTVDPVENLVLRSDDAAVWRHVVHAAGTLRRHQNWASLNDPWPSLLSSFCLATFYVLLALLIMTRSPAKAQADGLLPRIAAFVGSYLPWTITFFGKTDQALPNLLSTACVLIGMIMMLVTIRHLGRVVQFGAAGTFMWCKPVLIDGSSTHSISQKKS